MPPKQRHLQIPFRESLDALRCEGEPRDISPLVMNTFAGIHKKDLFETSPSGGDTRANRIPDTWANRILDTNRVPWEGRHLTRKGEMDSPVFVIQRITGKNRLRLERGEKQNGKQEPAGYSAALSSEDEGSSIAHLFDILQNLPPAPFEQSARMLVPAGEFPNVKLTRISRDGAVERYEKLRWGRGTMNVASPCKRRKRHVERAEMGTFRGTIQGEFERGGFFTPSDLTPDAMEASLEKGVVPNIPLNGESIVHWTIEKSYGRERVPSYPSFDRPRDREDDET